MNDFVNQGILTFVAKVKPGEAENLRTLLARMVPPHSDVESNDIVPFAEITSIHFARFVVIDKSLSEDETLRPVDPLLVFSTNYDKPQKAHLEQIVEVAGEGLDKIYSHCIGYPKENERSKETRISFLKSIRKGYGAYHVGAPGMSVNRIRMEGRLRDEIERYLDEQKVNRKWSEAADPEEIRDDIRRFIGQTDLSWALTPPKGRPLGWLIFRGNGWSTLLWALIKIVLSLPFIIIPIIPIMLRSRENSDPEFSRIRYDERAKELAAREDKVVQNQMTNMVDMKPGFFRLYMLKMFFSVIEVAARYYFTHGKLGSIPTIHFARWVFVDNNKALLFFSNYGSSWESYLGDFVDKAAVGLTGVWSNSVRFPRAKWLILRGATDEERFKCWARAQQMPTDVWYTAYKTLTVKNILVNKKIRQGLAKNHMSKEQALEWLRLL